MRKGNPLEPHNTSREKPIPFPNKNVRHGLTRRRHTSARLPCKGVRFSIHIKGGTRNHHLINRPTRVFFHVLLFGTHRGRRPKPRNPHTGATSVGNNLASTLGGRPRNSSPFPLEVIAFIPNLIDVTDSLRSYQLEWGPNRQNIPQTTSVA